MHAKSDDVTAAARAWLGTPYHDQASLKSVGCDCLGLARGVWRGVVGPEPFPIPPYSRDWGETGPREVLADGAPDRGVPAVGAEPDRHHQAWARAPDASAIVASMTVNPRRFL